jgi:hypothetical protein
VKEKPKGFFVIRTQSIPIGVPFEVGLPEITMTTLYVSLGVPAGIAATSTILSRLITLWLRTGLKRNEFTGWILYVGRTILVATAQPKTTTREKAHK